MHHARLKRLLEFFIIGLVFGITEDILAVALATDAELTFDVVAVVVLIAIPFAIFSELIVDHPRFLHLDRLAHWIRVTVLHRTASRPPKLPEALQVEAPDWPAHSYQCTVCETAFQTGPLLAEHVNHTHPDIAISWTVCATPDGPLDWS